MSNFDCPECGAHYLQPCASWCGDDVKTSDEKERSELKRLEVLIQKAHHLEEKVTKLVREIEEMKKEGEEK